MNITIEVGRKALMMGITLIAATVASACGNDTGAGAASSTSVTTSGTTSVASTSASPQYVITPGTYQGTADSFWAEVAGEKINSTGFVVDVDVDGPFYGPKSTAGDFSATARVGTKCVAVFAEAGGNGEDGSFATFLYVQTGDKMIPWAAHNGSEATVSGANRLIAHFRPHCA